MDKYEVIGLLGEGSFGRVYKAKQNSDGSFVALKVISKRGRSVKELKGLRRECEIQRYLHHPNIIQMLDSFETDNEIVVITEFGHKELSYILGKAGYLSEERVQAIVWDLVSALYYLHSHRVLHRDLKPQNILLDANNISKLCDFGFARNMSTGTHVLTSIKGTPLYMAPELIEEQPYDHNADLWSLGCIIYELLVGAPPFCTASILHLIRLIRHEQIQWPTFISEDCISFLKGLLQKNPAKRLTWPEILSHSFVKGHIIISESAPMALTRPMSANTLEVKEQQRNKHINQKTTGLKPNSSSKIAEANSTTLQSDSVKGNSSKASKHSSNSNTSQSGEKNKKSGSKESSNLTEKLSKISLNKKSTDSTENQTPPIDKTSTEFKIKMTLPLNFHEDSHPIESEEWMVFILKTIKEIMNCEIECLLQPSSTNILVYPLRNSNSSNKVIDFVANLFSLPFVVSGIKKESVEQIKRVYLEVKLVPNLIYSSKLLTTIKVNPSSANSTPTPRNSGSFNIETTFKSATELTDEDLQTLEYIYVLICHLVHSDDLFLSQFCDSVVVFNIYGMLQQLLTLCKRKIRIVVDLIAILSQILRKHPENFEIIDQVIVNSNEKKEILDFVGFLRNGNALLRERCCFLLLLLGKCSTKTVENIWNDKIRDTLEALMYDSMENVRNAAELAVDELKLLEFYKITTINVL